MGLRDGVGRLARGWGVPIVGATALLIAVNILVPDVGHAFGTVAYALYWLPFALIWIAAGTYLVSIALWLIPAMSLSVAWFVSGEPQVGWLIIAVMAGVLAVTFFSPAVDWWRRFSFRVTVLLLHIAQTHADREIDVAAAAVLSRVGVAAQTALADGGGRYGSDLVGIRKAAADLPTTELDAAKLRQALLKFVDALHDEAVGNLPGTSASAAAIAELREALDHYRRRTRTYRILTLRRSSS